MQLNALFRHKEPQFEPEVCLVEKIIELDPLDYEDFQNNMLRGWDFITESNGAMRGFGDSAIHCLLVLGEDYADGILVDSQGADYARRAAFIPGARQLLAAEQQRTEQTFTEQIRQVEGAELLYAPAWIVFVNKKV